MKIKETSITVSVPYKKEDFQYGKVELTATLVLGPEDDAEDAAAVRQEQFDLLYEEAKAFIAQMAEPETEPDWLPPTQPVLRRRPRS